VKTLAALPSREVLLAKAFGGMKAPISQFVGVLSGTIRKVVTVIDAIAKKKGAE
jgi:large subunit ribosomal protein L10